MVIAGNDDLFYVGRVVIRHKIVCIRNIVCKVPIILRACVSENNSTTDDVMNSLYKMIYINRKSRLRISVSYVEFISKYDNRNKNWDFVGTKQGRNILKNNKWRPP